MKAALIAISLAAFSSNQVVATSLTAASALTTEATLMKEINTDVPCCKGLHDY